MIVIGGKANLLQRGPSWLLHFPPMTSNRQHRLKMFHSTRFRSYLDLYSMPMRSQASPNTAFPAEYQYRGRVMNER
jgi:hypothetical protein